MLAVQREGRVCRQERRKWSGLTRGAGHFQKSKLSACSMARTCTLEGCRWAPDDLTPLRTWFQAPPGLSSSTPQHPTLILCGRGAEMRNREGGEVQLENLPPSWYHGWTYPVILWLPGITTLNCSITLLEFPLTFCAVFLNLAQNNPSEVSEILSCKIWIQELANYNRPTGQIWVFWWMPSCWNTATTICLHVA